ncbi:hypothetical protein CGLO_13302 [Colletotrichum gloeosporioides Cg-14]|uniref:Uncharacterized protein n=1 Tax=Colletotrichum gloeosporioides (strain Cg-14) TaxID=1237896 RepID=T0LH81_COLGC|nr:hypothetical protein CGLO_13302 [Colletotrichum gloeosporioides Cg-14]
MFPFNSALNPASVAKRQRPELPSPRHEERACMEVPEDDEMADATEDLDFRFHDIDTEPGTRARKAPVPREMTGNDDDFEHDARAPVLKGGSLTFENDWASWKLLPSISGIFLPNGARPTTKQACSTFMRVLLCKFIPNKQN